MGIFGKSESPNTPLLREILDEVKKLKDEMKVLKEENCELKKEINELRQEEESATKDLVAHMKRAIDNQIIIEKKIIQHRDDYLIPIHQNVYNMYNDVERELRNIKGKI